jgi:hypothetical protein
VRYGRERDAKETLTQLIAVPGSQDLADAIGRLKAGSL